MYSVGLSGIDDKPGFAVVSGGGLRVGRLPGKKYS